ncbi:MAG TPA: sugar ABC transporter permease, partial [Methylomirabilota bacterium]|nr:sugar ABC transporter permease [Methylomirabilota bacterium]
MPISSRRLGRWAHRHARWLFPAPAVLLVAAIIVYPILYTVWMSLQEWSASSLIGPRFIGMANYHKIALADARFQEAVGRTIYFTIVAVGAETLLGLAMALLFNREFWGRGLLRTLAILPMVATPTAIALVFVMMYHPSLGVANYLLSVVGLSPWRWTYSSQTALYALALVDVWQWTPLIMLIALAGLASLPREPYEAAHIDGASTLRAFWHITLPLLRPALVVAVLFR